MPDAVPPAPPEPPPASAAPPAPATPPEPEITLDEWIAATQSCCGADHGDE